MTANLRIVPLGGLGHIGGNMTAFETPNDMIVVDCGVLFPRDEEPGIDCVLPKYDYLLQRKEKLRAYVITHGHEDHIGALPWVLRDLPAPVYATCFTLELIRQRTLDKTHVKADLHLLRDREPVTLGEFVIDPIPMTHSIPDAVALAINTPVGWVVHTGDFKFDQKPIDQRLSDVTALEQLGQKGVQLLLSDSTNAEKDGHTWSESEIVDPLTTLIQNARQRICVTLFASNIQRLQIIFHAAKAAGRSVIPVGRSMQQYLRLAIEHNYIKIPPGTLSEVEYFDRLKPHQALILASGSQGELQSALTRIAQNRHERITLGPGDRVIFSSRRIPGNERAVGAVVADFLRRNIEVVDDRHDKVHTSGHAFSGELLQMLQLCRPKFFVPIHGELRHLLRHAQLAQSTGIKPENILVTENGYPIELTQKGDKLFARRADPVIAGFTYVDGNAVGQVDHTTLRDRRILADNGIVVCTVVFDKRGRLACDPLVQLRGVINEETFPDLRSAAARTVKAALKHDGANPEQTIRTALRGFFRQRFDLHPVLIPVIQNLE